MGLDVSAFDRTIVLHDYFRFTEGGGRLCLILAQQLKADVGYGFKKPGHAFFEEYRITGRQVDVGAIGMFPGWRNLSLIRSFQRNTAFLKKYKTAIYSGFYAPLGVGNHPKGKNVYYCHTPPRYIYDQRGYYRSRYPGCLHPLIDLLTRYHQPHYEASVKMMDCVVTNSHAVRERISRFLGIEATVVHPPCEVEKFRWIGQDGFYLSAARLDPLKRVDLVVDAFTRMPEKRLVVISAGPELRRIRRMASGHANIRILGSVSETTYRRLMGTCIATIYIPRDEDFGMTAIESMAAGKPVIAVREGGLVETVQPTVTGMLIDADPTVDDLVDAVTRLDESQARRMMHSCRTHARRFDVHHFMTKINELLS